MKIINTKSELNKLTNAKDVILLHPSLAQYIVHKKLIPIVPYEIAKNDTMIDDFYNQLKVLIDNGQIREIRIDGESYLEAVK